MNLPDWESLSPQTRASVTAVVIAMIAAMTVVVLALTHQPHALSATLKPLASDSPMPWASPTTSSSVTIDVEGEVHRPGLETLPAGSRVADALKAAGGVLNGAHLDGLNLARKVVDGEQIVVGAQPPVAASSSTTAAAGQPLNLNLATLTDLDGLPGVGPVMAQRILDWRTAHGSFATVDQLREVQGIGDVTFARLKPLVTV